MHCRTEVPGCRQPAGCCFLCPRNMAPHGSTIHSRYSQISRYCPSLAKQSRCILVLLIFFCGLYPLLWALAPFWAQLAFIEILICRHTWPLTPLKSWPVWTFHDFFWLATKICYSYVVASSSLRISAWRKASIHCQHNPWHGLEDPCDTRLRDSCRGLWMEVTSGNA